LRTESLWWVSVRATVPDAPDAKLVGPGADAPIEAGPDGIGELGVEDELSDASAPDLGVFEATKPSPAWKPHTFPSGVRLAGLKLPPQCAVLAATRVHAPKAAEVKVRVGRETEDYVWLDEEMLGDRRDMAERRKAVKPTRPPWFVGRVWLNDELVYDSRPRKAKKSGAEAPDEKAKGVLTGQLKAGPNTMLVQCVLGEDLARDPGTFFVFLQDPATGKRIKNLVMDIRPR